MPAANFHQVLRDMGLVLTPLMKEEHVAEPLFRLHSGRTAFKLEVTWIYERATQIPQPPSSEPVTQKSGRRRRRRRRCQTTAQQQQQQSAAARRPEKADEPMEAKSAPDLSHRLYPRLGLWHRRGRACRRLRDWADRRRLFSPLQVLPCDPGRRPWHPRINRLHR